MKDVSNNTITMLLVITVIVSLGGTMIALNAINNKFKDLGLTSITGFALAPNGTASLDIEKTASIIFHADGSSVAFGTGQVAASQTNCTLSTVEGTYGANSGCTGFNAVTNGFTIENNGGTNLSVEMLSNVSAIDFIGSQGAQFLWNVTLNETGSCLNSTSEAQVHPNTSNTHCGGPLQTACGTIFENVSISYKIICPRLLAANSNDQLNIDINITIPDDAPAGDKLAGLTVRGTTVTA